MGICIKLSYIRLRISTTKCSCLHLVTSPFHCTTMFVKSTQGRTHTALIGQLGESPFRTIAITTTMLLNSSPSLDQHSLPHIALGPVSTSLLIGLLGVSIRKYVALQADMLHWFAKCSAVHSEITATKVMSLRFLGFWDISISRNYDQILSFKLCNF